MIGHAILSHGLESGPNATKVSALAAAAEALGWTTERPDYLACDRAVGHGDFGDIDARIAILRERAHAAKGPVVLAGSSMGAFISALVSREIACVGLFLMAPPPWIEGYRQPLEAAIVPTFIVHGWDDELIPAQSIVDWARPRRDRMVLVNDSHRLADHVAFCAERFADFLKSL
ncbi:MAG TPA: alpha/beta fold hydrolase [Xanthomonadaceae bacterium]|nr:alpha/beta fold hydrolase [Xanthomonadaceae bacterium]